MKAYLSIYLSKRKSANFILFLLDINLIYGKFMVRRYYGYQDIGISGHQRKEGIIYGTINK